MEQNIVELIKSLAEKAESFHSLGEVESSKIAQAAETLGVEFAKDFVEYTQTFGAIELNYEEYCGVNETNYISTVQCTQNMREISDFPKDCYVIHSLGIDNIVDVQKSDGKIYQYAPGYELELIANSLGEFLLNEFEGQDNENKEKKPDNDSKDADAENYYKEGLESYRRGEFQKAVSHWRKAAELGHGESLNELGCSYTNGEGVEINHEEAVKFYRMAAELGNADGQYNLGYNYENGIGVNQDYEAALKWYTKAAEQGHASASCNLGVLYHNGMGVPQDYKKAAYWYEKAIAKGDVHSMNNMGLLYYMENDYAKAAEWFEKAANLNDNEALFNIGFMYYRGYGVEQNYETAISWYTKGAYKDNADAQGNLGDCYEHGHGVPVNFKKAVYWYTKAADNGNEEAQESLQTLRKDGYYDQSFEWFTKAFERGDASAAYELAVCYEKGKGVKEDHEKAAKWRKIAAERGYPKAQDCYDELMEESGETEDIDDEEDVEQESEPFGWDAITAEFERLYPGQTNPKHYGVIIPWSLGGNDPLQGISAYDAGDYWHFVTYGLTDLYEKESDDEEWSGYGYEMTLKLKKYDFEDEEAEIKCVCGILQSIARIIFKGNEIFRPYEYIYTGQKAGIDVKQESNLTGFICVPDSSAQTIHTPNGKVEFLQLIGMTDAELLTLKSGKSVEDIYNKLGSDLTDYHRESIV